MKLDDLDRRILGIIQRDSTMSLDELSKQVGSSKTPVWNRIRKMKESGVITRQVALLNPDAIGLGSCFFVMVRTSQHETKWLDDFQKALMNCDEIMEAHRLSGDIDYVLKVYVRDARHFDEFYKRLIDQVSIFNVTSAMSMEVMKSETAFQLS